MIANSVRNVDEYSRAWAIVAGSIHGNLRTVCSLRDPVLVEAIFGGLGARFRPALLSQDLNISHIHIDCYRPHNEMNREYDAQPTPPPEQNSFKSAEWTVYDSDSASYGEIRMRFGVVRSLEAVPQSFNIFDRQWSCYIIESHQAYDAGNLQDIQPLPERMTHKDIPRKKRQRDSHSTVFPASYCFVKRQKILD
jgi:hypothetical protein